jgi:hypothetical protein
MSDLLRWGTLLLLIVTFTVAADTNDGLVLPPGFHADVVYEGSGPARHLAVRANGDIYVTTQLPPFSTYDPALNRGILALRDTDKDGRIDHVESFRGASGHPSTDRLAATKDMKRWVSNSCYRNIHPYSLSVPKMLIWPSADTAQLRIAAPTYVVAALTGFK